MDASQIKAHMEVIGSDEQHVGTVDHVDGQRIKLTRKDSGSEGEHRYLDLSMVSSCRTDGFGFPVRPIKPASNRRAIPGFVMVRTILIGMVLALAAVARRLPMPI